MHILDNEYMISWVLLSTSWKKWNSAHFGQWVHAMNGKKRKASIKNNKKLKRSRHRTLTADQTKLTERRKGILVAAQSHINVKCWKQRNYEHLGQWVHAYLGPSAFLSASKVRQKMNDLVPISITGVKMHIFLREWPWPAGPKSANIQNMHVLVTPMAKMDRFGFWAP